MIITKNKLFSGIFLFGLTTIILVLFNIQIFYLRAIFSFIFLTIIPGLLITLMLKVRKIEFWEYLVYTIGLSIAFLMFAGLAVNWILPFLHITDKPLSLMPLLTSFDIILSIFGFIAYKRNKKISLKMSLPKLNRLNKAFFLVPLIFPILSILGATTLNNGGSNYLTMIMLGGIAAYVFFMVLFRNKLNENVYPLGIILISFSLLSSYSLRSWHITGWDIHQEYYVFQLTKNIGYWTMSNFQDAYNACLSITILPTILSIFLHIKDEYIFKILYPLIFSLIPLVIYVFLNKFTSKTNALLSSFFFISQATFFIGFDMVLRQGIAILLFSLFIYCLINSKLNNFTENFLLVIFGFSMIVSHYSTTYVALTILLIAYILNLAINSKNIKKYFPLSQFKIDNFLNKIKINEYKINLKFLLIFFLLAYLWFGLLTNTSGGIVTFISETINSKGEVFSPDMFRNESSFINQFNIFYRQDLDFQLKNYIGGIVDDYRKNPSIQLSQIIDNAYVPEITYSKLIPITIDQNFSRYTIQSVKIIKIVVKVLLIIGIFYLFITKARKYRLNKEYILLILTCLILLGIGVLLPFVVRDYDVLRLYQQLLVLLSLSVVTGSLIVFNIFPHNLKYILAASLFIIFFLLTTGFIPQLVGGLPANMQLNNYGEDYDRFYIHESETKSARWLSSSYDKKNLVYADRFASWILMSFGNITKTQEDVLPTTLDQNSYVYLRYANAVQDINFKRFNGQFLYFNYPVNYLDQNKNLIYNNIDSKIYR